MKSLPVINRGRAQRSTAGETVNTDVTLPMYLLVEHIRQYSPPPLLLRTHLSSQRRAAAMALVLWPSASRYFRTVYRLHIFSFVRFSFLLLLCSSKYMPGLPFSKRDLKLLGRRAGLYGAKCARSMPNSASPRCNPSGLRREGDLEDYSRASSSRGMTLPDGENRCKVLRLKYIVFVCVCI